MSALLAKRLALHTIEERERSDLTDINKQLIQCCANTLTQDREFSGPEIMAYLMGWGDRFKSHHYIGISVDRIMGALKERHPGLRSPSTNAQCLSGLASAINAQDSDSINECSHTIMMVEGEITLKDQLHEYIVL